MREYPHIPTLHVAYSSIDTPKDTPLIVSKQLLRYRRPLGLRWRADGSVVVGEATLVATRCPFDGEPVPLYPPKSVEQVRFLTKFQNWILPLSIFWGVALFSIPTNLPSWMKNPPFCTCFSLFGFYNNIYICEMVIFTANGCYTLPFIWELSRNPWDFQPHIQGGHSSRGARRRSISLKRRWVPQRRSRPKATTTARPGHWSQRSFIKWPTAKKMRRFLEEW